VTFNPAQSPAISLREEEGVHSFESTGTGRAERGRQLERNPSDGKDRCQLNAGLETWILRRRPPADTSGKKGSSKGKRGTSETTAGSREFFDGPDGRIRTGTPTGTRHCTSERRGG